MRVLALLLLAANVGYLAWDLDQRLRRDGPPPAPARGAPAASLTLLSELEELPARRRSGSDSEGQEVELGGGKPGQVAVLAREQAGAPAPADGEACLRLGPLERRGEADRLERWLRAQGLSFWRLAQNLGERRLLWVYLEPSASEAAARDRLQQLEAQGLEDYMLIKRGGLKNAISLGLFSSQESVNRRLAELSDKGYQPVVVPRYQTQRRFWFDVAESALQARAPAGDEPPVPLQPAAALCGQIAAAQASQ